MKSFSQDVGLITGLRQLDRLINDLLLAYNQGCVSLLVLLNLSHATFDTTDHNILLEQGCQTQILPGPQHNCLRHGRAIITVFVFF